MQPFRVICIIIPEKQDENPIVLTKKTDSNET